MPFGDLLQRSGTLGEPLADGLGGQRAGGFGAQPGDFGGQGGDVLAGTGDVYRCGPRRTVRPRWPRSAACSGVRAGPRPLSQVAMSVLRLVGHLHDVRERLDGGEPQLDGLAVAEELSLVTSATASPRTRVELSQSALSSVELKTYFGMALSRPAQGWTRPP
jgi:hypothetical protein